jgi:uncharacterized lipoprotein YmbA
MRTVRSLALVMTVAALGSCSSSPVASFYTLSVVAARDEAPAVHGIAVVVGPVTVPELVDRPQFVDRVSENEVRIDEFARWADSPKSQIPRVIASELAVLLPGARVSVYPADPDSAAAYRVRVDIQRFDGAPGDAVTVDALWSARPPKNGTPVNGRTVVHEPAAGPGNGALAAAYSAALAAVSRDIAAAISASPLK